MRRYELEINGKHFSIAVHDYSPRRAELEIEGTRYTVDVTDIVTEGEAPTRPLAAGAGGVVRKASAAPPSAPAPAPTPPGGGGAGRVAAPIPGQILEIMVEKDQEVQARQPLLKMEAMKMENVIAAPVAGRVEAIHVNPGDAVTQGQELVVIG